MGNLLSLPRDVLRMIFRYYLGDVDRALLLWSAKIYTELTEHHLNRAAKCGHFKTLKWLKEYKCPGGKSAARKACLSGHLDVVKWLRQQGYETDYSHYMMYSIALYQI